MFRHHHGHLLSICRSSRSRAHPTSRCSARRNVHAECLWRAELQRWHRGRRDRDDYHGRDDRTAQRGQYCNLRSDRTVRHLFSRTHRSGKCRAGYRLWRNSRQPQPNSYSISPSNRVAAFSEGAGTDFYIGWQSGSYNGYYGVLVAIAGYDVQGTNSCCMPEWVVRTARPIRHHSQRRSSHPSRLLSPAPSPALACLV